MKLENREIDFKSGFKNAKGKNEKSKVDLKSRFEKKFIFIMLLFRVKITNLILIATIVQIKRINECRKEKLCLK